MRTSKGAMVLLTALMVTVGTAFAQPALPKEGIPKDAPAHIRYYIQLL